VRRKLLILGPLCVLAVHQIGDGACAQQSSAAPRFEVASIRPCAEQTEAKPGDRKGDSRESSPVRLHLPCQTLMSMIQWAFGNFAEGRFNPSASVRISGGPGWIDTERFQIDATSEIPRSSGTMNGPMLRALLEDRFHLVIRREVEETPVYALTVNRGARPGIPRSSHNCVAFDPEHPPLIEPGKPLPVVCGMAAVTDKGWNARGVTMRRFAELLSDYADRKLIDRTGLSGEFDIHLDLSPSDLGHPPLNPAEQDKEPTRDPGEVFATLRAQVRKLGLRIESAKARTESLRIQSAEKPGPD
jgi:uncharacterized protein (TIGR03435 family)